MKNQEILPGDIVLVNGFSSYEKTPMEFIGMFRGLYICCNAGKVTDPQHYYFHAIKETEISLPEPKYGDLVYWYHSDGYLFSDNPCPFVGMDGDRYVLKDTDTSTDPFFSVDKIKVKIEF